MLLYTTEVVKMKGLQLTMKEKDKYKTIAKVHNKKISIKRAAIILGLSERRVRDLLLIYKNDGLSGFSHKSKNKTPVNKAPSELSNTIIALYENKYYGFNFTHFNEKLEELENIKVSYGFLYKTLSEAGFTSPKANKKIKKNKKHPSRERKKCFGELVQMDASIHLWFGNTKYTLHAAIDDSTGTLLGAYFDKQETLYGYYNVFYQILTKYGIPMCFYTDKRTIFEYKKKSQDIQNDTFTQFQTACNFLGTDIITTSVPQAKGRIERLFNTLQDRLISEMRLKGIKSVEEANKFLQEYIHIFNNKFALQIDYTTSMMEIAPKLEEINVYLSIFTKRKVNNGCTVSISNKQYFPVLNDDKVYLYPKTDVIILKAFNSDIYILHDNKFYNTIEFIKDSNPVKEETIVKERKVYRPPATHPWKAASYQKRIHQLAYS